MGEGGSRRLTDEVSITLIALSRQRTHLIHARLPCLGDADRVCFANRSIPAFIAGVQTMRARICSTFSCDMFARVVWLKSWGAAKPPTFDLSLAVCTRHAWLARLTRARGESSQREGNALFDDFWYFWSCKSTIKKKVTFATPSRRRRSEVATPP